MTIPGIEREEEVGVEQRAEEASPLKIERKEVLTPTPSRFSGQVFTDKGKPIIETPESKEIMVEIPRLQSDLQTLSKGSGDDAITWFARFWLRIIKKALSLGAKLIMSKN